MANARINISTKATIKSDRIFASGTPKNVYAGAYPDRGRNGKPCLAKEFKTGSVMKVHYFEEEMNDVRRAGYHRNLQLR